MLVHLNQIPPEGLHIEGEEPPSILDPTDPLITPDGPIRYRLDVGISGNGLFATGVLECEMQMVCVSCLEPFRRTLTLDHFALQIDLPGPETVDLTPYVREDIFLALPPHPRCGWDGSRTCPGPKVVSGARPAEPGEAAAAWGALDQLDLKKEP